MKITLIYRFRKTSLAIMLFLLAPVWSFAVHVAGGEFEYTYINQHTNASGQLMYTYLVKYHYYGMCNAGATGGVVDASKTLNDIVTNPVTDWCRIVNTNSSIPYIDIGTILHYESVRTLPSDCACENGYLNGYREYVFSGEVDIPYIATSPQWYFKLQDYKRNNVTSSGATGFFVDSYLNLAPSGTHNNSVKFSNPLMIFPLQNQSFTYNFGAMDIDGDSLSYELVNPLIAPGVNLTYYAGFTYSTPFATNGSISVDQVTGMITGISTVVQTVVMAVKVKEYRAGVLIGSVTRDVQIKVVPGSNSNPLLSGINNTTQYNIQASTGTQLCFTVNSSDPNSDNVTISSSDLNTVIPSATLGVTGNSTNTPITTICWTPSASDLGKQFCFTIRAEDNACHNPNLSPPSVNGVTIKNYCITVNALPKPCCENPQISVTSISSPWPSTTVLAGEGKGSGPFIYCTKENLQFKVDSCGCTKETSNNFVWTFVNTNTHASVSQTGCTIEQALADTGKFTITLAISGSNCDTTKLNTEIIIKKCDSLPCSNCIGSFAPEPGKKFVLTAWAKEEGAQPTTTNYTHPQIYIEYPNLGASYTVGPFSPNGEIIDGWQRIEEEFTIPVNATYINIKLKSNTGNCFFDDIRIHPFDGSMKSFVYDPVTLRLSAELDERNYATFYEYDEEGKLIRVKKETEKGVMTIKENKNSTRKK